MTNLLRLKWIAKCLLVLACGLAVLAAIGIPADWWLTADQQGDRLFASQQYSQAAEVYLDPVRKGSAFYREGDFEESAAAFARKDDAESAFNRGDALMLLGEYDAAIASFERALQFRPDWKEARENRDIAIARREWMKPPEDDAGGTGGQLEADEYVFDDRAKNSKNTEEVEGESDQPMSDEELRLLWLQRVQTSPADFLKSKFAYQLSRQGSSDRTVESGESDLKGSTGTSKEEQR